jgi:hypothetical protein
MPEDVWAPLARRFTEHYESLFGQVRTSGVELVLVLSLCASIGEELWAEEALLTRVVCPPCALSGSRSEGRGRRGSPPALVLGVVDHVRPELFRSNGCSRSDSRTSPAPMRSRPRRLGVPTRTTGARGHARDARSRCRVPSARVRRGSRRPGAWARSRRVRRPWDETRRDGTYRQCVGTGPRPAPTGKGLAATSRPVRSEDNVELCLERVR